MSSVIKIENLCKSFGEIKAVDNLSFKVKEGELFAFLGVNGAGKSTTISIMCGTLEKDSGKVYIDGVDTDIDGESLKRKIGVVFQNSVLDKSLTVYDNLASRAAIYGIFGDDFKSRLDYLATLLDFKNLYNRTVGKLSGGQRRKIDIARALIHNPKILILDEPTTGLDPQTRQTLWAVVEKFRIEQRMTVLLTTHYMEEAADADFVLIIDGGKTVAEGTPVQLKNEYTGDYIYFYNAEEDKIKKLEMPYERVGQALRVLVSSTAQATALIKTHPELFVDYEITKGKMDSVFLAVTGKSLVGGSDK